MLEALGLEGSELRERPRQVALCQVAETQQSAEGKEEEDAQRSFQRLPESISRGEGQPRA